MSDPGREFRIAVNDVRLVGGLFVFLGALPMLAALIFRGRGDPAGARVLAAVNTIVLFGPGVWYVAASIMMRRMNRPALRQAVWVARAQLVLVPGTLGLSSFAAAAFGHDPRFFHVPAVIALFFVPALIALLFTLRQIGWLMNHFEPEAHGFEAAVPLQALRPADECVRRVGR